MGNRSVVDLHGESTSVSISSDGTVSAFVTEITESSANDLASRLYSATFRGELVNSTLAVLGVAEREHFSAGAISVQPQAFAPLVPTSTTTRLTTTSLTTTTLTTSSAVTSTQSTGMSTSTTTPPSNIPFNSGATTPLASLAWLLLLLSSGLLMNRM